MAATFVEYLLNGPARVPRCHLLASRRLKRADPFPLNGAPNLWRASRLLNHIDSAAEQFGQAVLNGVEPLKAAKSSRSRREAHHDIDIRNRFNPGVARRRAKHQQVPDPKRLQLGLVTLQNGDDLIAIRGLTPHARSGSSSDTECIIPDAEGPSLPLPAGAEKKSQPSPERM
jgi:hypothetical protein